MNIVIYHNPDCGTSRNVLNIIQSAGYEPTVIEYINEGWTRPQLLGLFAAAGLTPKTALRETKSPAKELGLLEPTVGDDEILAKPSFLFSYLRIYLYRKLYGPILK